VRPVSDDSKHSPAVTEAWIELLLATSGHSLHTASIRKAIAAAERDAAAGSRPVESRTLKHFHRLSSGDKVAIVEEYRAGAASLTLQRKYRVGKETITMVLRDAGVQLRPRGISEAVRQQIAQMVQQGLPRDEICRQTGVGRMGLDRMLDGVSSRPSLAPLQP
jgi:hypothetical protein